MMHIAAQLSTRRVYTTHGPDKAQSDGLECRVWSDSVRRLHVSIDLCRPPFACTHSRDRACSLLALAKILSRRRSWPDGRYGSNDTAEPVAFLKSSRRLRGSDHTFQNAADENSLSPTRETGAFMATTPVIVLKVECGSTLKTSVNGVAVEIECEGDSGGSWTLPDPPSSGGGVVAYAAQAEDGARLDLSVLAERFQAGSLNIENLPEIDAGAEWVVFADEIGNVRSMRDMTTEEGEMPSGA